MAYYYKLGNLPPKRHIQFRQPDGSLYKEELVSSKGFSGIYSNLYHTYSPRDTLFNYAVVVFQMSVERSLKDFKAVHEQRQPVR